MPENEKTDGIDGASADRSFAARIELLRNGPLKVEGPVTITDSEGNQIQTREKFFLCRCGASKNKPFCDGSHNRIGFAPER